MFVIIRNLGPTGNPENQSAVVDLVHDSTDYYESIRLHEFNGAEAWGNAVVWAQKFCGIAETHYSVI
jgi:hypothetical protein